jgi:hypothetical protein
MSNESVCQVTGSWVDVGSFHTRLFGVLHVTCGDFHDGSVKGTADRVCGKFYDFYSVSSEYFGYHHVMFMKR